MKVIRGLELQLDLSKFKRIKAIKESPNFEWDVSQAFKKHSLVPAKETFNSSRRHIGLDLGEQVVKYDYVWFDADDQVIAFYNHKDQKLYF
jgi:hypothetical protein